MKVKSFLLTALAASMTFVACDNKDDEMGQLDNTPKSVSIDLSNVIPVTRGAGQEVEDNSKVSLTDLQVFFTDGTTLYKGKTIEGTEATHYFSNKSNFDDRADKVFHFLPAEVNKVIVVGNNGSQINASTYVDLKKDLIIAEQQNPTDLDLYKEVELTSVSGQDEAGHPLYKAKVVLEPRVSRIEIGKFEYTAPTQGQRKYKSIEVQQVMLNNYFGSVREEQPVTYRTPILTPVLYSAFSRQLLMRGITMNLPQQRVLQPPCLWLHWMKIHSISIPTRKAMSVLHTTSFLKIIILEILTILKFL